jgi:hypothetical protein
MPEAPTDIPPLKRATDDLISFLPPLHFTTQVSFLAGLGSATAIRDFFGRRGIRGRNKDPFACPVANFVRRSLNNDFYLILVCANWTTINGQRVHNPLPVFMFVRQFDKGAYPELIECDARLLG